MTRRLAFFGRSLLAALVLLGADAARAGSGSIDVEQFRPQIDGRGLFTAESAETHHPWQLGVGLILHYSKSPLAIRVEGLKTDDVVDNRLTGELVLSLGLTGWLEVGAALPVALLNDQNAGLGGLSNVTGLGSMRFQLKLRLLSEERHGIGIALLPRLTLPTGNNNAFLGQNQVVFAPALLLERGAGPVRFLLNVGYRIREETSYFNLRVGNELFWRFGIGIRLHERVELGAELLGATAGDDPFGGDETRNPLEALAGLRILLGPRWHLQIGGGPGLSLGYGTPGFRAFAGLVFAPHEVDTDRDGIPDRRDRCRRVPGPAENRGCPWPDSDGDGLTDNVDKCPTVAGPRANNGCPWPDSDGDGVLDKDDRCPAVPGPRANHGCPWPDTDGDGVLDKDDRCPKVAGPKANQGCPWPDTDGDGVLDKDDSCPKVAGPKANKGCPWSDSDGDGILDKDDRCPAVAGPKANRGCPWPDTDGDGVPDKDDDCPTEKGPVSNHGCPKRSVVVTKTEVRILDRVFFRSGSAKILPRSFRILDAVADALKRATHVLRIEVQGHTDDVGRARYNRRLSQRRAESVVSYLIRKGTAPSRLIAKGYGEDQPLVPVHKKMSKKAKAEARSMNRRVQFKILRQKVRFLFVAP